MKNEPRLVLATREVMRALIEPVPQAGPGSTNPFGAVGLSQQFLDAHPSESVVTKEEIEQIEAGLQRATSDIVAYTKLVNLGRQFVDQLLSVVGAGGGE